MISRLQGSSIAPIVEYFLLIDEKSIVAGNYNISKIDLLEVVRCVECGYRCKLLESERLMMFPALVGVEST